MNNQQRLFKHTSLVRCLALAGLCSTALYSTIGVADDFPLGNMECYAVADEMSNTGSPDILVKIDKNTGVTTAIGATGTNQVEAVEFSLNRKVLYAVDGGVFGKLDLETAAFTAIGSGLGSGNGVDGVVNFNDVDSLTIDIPTGILYGTLRREKPDNNELDLLVQINTTTGTIMKDTFSDGNGGTVDYVPITNAKVDVDDLASDPTDGTLYAIANDGNGANGSLYTLDKLTGIATLVGDNINDIEGLTFAPDGTLLGSTGRGSSLGEAGNTTKNRLYEVNKATGLTSEVGRMSPLADGEKSLVDFEALACRSDNFGGIIGDESKCVMYAVHDEGLNNTQIIEIDPYANNGVGIVRPLGPMHALADVEGLAITPATVNSGEFMSGILYGSSGASGNSSYTGPAGPDGMLYQITRTGPNEGALNPIGLTGYSEVSALSINPVTNTLWGWARGVRSTVEHGKEAGLITIDPATGVGTMVKKYRHTDFASGHRPDIESIVWNNDGTLLYGVAGRDLWVYDPSAETLTMKCPDMVGAEIEALEMQPNGIALIGTDGKQEIAIVAYDFEACEVVASRSFKGLPYDDIESIEWPSEECQGRSWLYRGSWDAKVELIQYDPVDPDIEDALLLALQDAGLGGAGVENEDGQLTVYTGNQLIFTVQPTVQTTRRATRDGEKGDVSKARLITNPDGSLVLEILYSSGALSNVTLNPVAADEASLSKGLSSLGEAEINDDGTIRLTVADGATLCGTLSVEITQANVPEGAALQATTDKAELYALGDIGSVAGDADGIDDYMVVTPIGESQKIFGSVCK